MIFGWFKFSLPDCLCIKVGLLCQMEEGYIGDSWLFGFLLLQNWAMRVVLLFHYKCSCSLIVSRGFNAQSDLKLCTKTKQDGGFGWVHLFIPSVQI